MAAQRLSSAIPLTQVLAQRHFQRQHPPAKSPATARCPDTIASYLIDMYGNVVHYWPYPEGSSVPGSEAIEKHAVLLEDGTLLRGFIDTAHRAGMGGAVYQLADWDGEVLWQHDEERPGYTPHHDSLVITSSRITVQSIRTTV